MEAAGRRLRLRGAGATLRRGGTRLRDVPHVRRQHVLRADRRRRRRGVRAVRSRIGGAEFGLSAMAGRRPEPPRSSTFSCRTSTGTTSRASPSSSPYVPGNRIRIYGCHDALADAFRRQHGAPSFPVEFRSSARPSSSCSWFPGSPTRSPARVTAKRQFHSGDSYAYRFERDGKVMVYSTDSEHKLDHAASAAEFADFFATPTSSSSTRCTRWPTPSPSRRTGASEQRRRCRQMAGVRTCASSITSRPTTTRSRRRSGARPSGSRS